MEEARCGSYYLRTLGSFRQLAAVRFVPCLGGTPESCLIRDIRGGPSESRIRAAVLAPGFFQPRSRGGKKGPDSAGSAARTRLASLVRNALFVGSAAYFLAVCHEHQFDHGLLDATDVLVHAGAGATVSWAAVSQVLSSHLLMEGQTKRYVAFSVTRSVRMPAGIIRGRWILGGRGAVIGMEICSAVFVASLLIRLQKLGT